MTFLLVLVQVFKCEAVGVGGGAQALEKLQELGFGAFDMVLMDVQMPGEKQRAYSSSWSASIGFL